MKACPFSLNNPNGVKECLTGDCMAWLPELKIDISSLLDNKEMTNVIKSMMAGLTPMKVTFDDKGVVTVPPHCILLESKK